MSSLNLVPNPSVMLVQVGLFVSSFVIIKKLFLEPYLKVSDQREALTKGSVKDAASIIKANECSQIQIDGKLSQMRDESAKLRESAHTAAQQEALSIVSAAESDSKSAVEAIKKGIEIELQEERVKIPRIVEDLTASMFKQVLDF